MFCVFKNNIFQIFCHNLPSIPIHMHWFIPAGWQLFEVCNSWGRIYTVSIGEMTTQVMIDNEIEVVVSQSGLRWMMLTQTKKYAQLIDWIIEYDMRYDCKWLRCNVLNLNKIHQSGDGRLIVNSIPSYESIDQRLHKRKSSVTHFKLNYRTLVVL